MKKLLHIVLSFVLVSGAYAHEVKLFGGCNFSRYTVSPEVYNDYIDAWPLPVLATLRYKDSYKTGVLVGMGVEFPLTRILSIEIDGFYSRKGSHFTLVGTIGVNYVMAKKINYYLDTLILPVLLKIKFLPKSSPYIFAGLEPSFIMSHSHQESNWYTLPLPEEQEWFHETSIKHITKSFDYGPVIGGGFEVKKEKASMFIEVRYHLGMENIITSEDNHLQSIKTNDIAILFGFKSSRRF
jgi:hypothetical protein